MKLANIIFISLCICFVLGSMSAVSQNGRGQTFPISEMTHNEIHTASAYNIIQDQFIVVWEDDRNGNPDIYGRIVNADGSFAGPEFIVCSGPANQMYPAVDYNRIRDEYMVVWENVSDAGTDVYGIRLANDGTVIMSPRSATDGTFVVSDASMCQLTPKIAHNYTHNTYVVVWQDNRYMSGPSGADIYAQRLNWNADLMLPVVMPAESPATHINYAVSRGVGWDESYWEVHPDIAYHGGEDPLLDEWLVVFMRSWLHYYSIWAVRLRGVDGMLLDTYGEVPDHLVDIIEFKPNVLGGPPWFPEFAAGYWVDADQGSPHVNSNAYWSPFGKSNRMYTYPIPEFLIVWTDFRGAMPDIYCQRVAYFPDTTAVRMGLKQNLVADSLFTAVLLDTLGDWMPFPGWFPGENDPVTTNAYYQSWNDLTYNQNNGEYFVVWNDWRASAWDGSQEPVPEADIYAQRLFLDPTDSSLVWLDHDGNPVTDRTANIPIAATRSPDEGNMSYPAPAHGIMENEYLVAYEYDMPANNANIDVHGAFYAGMPPASVERKTTALVPEAFMLSQNYPNPFNPHTTIEFRLPSSERAMIRVFDMMGREIVTLVDQNMAAGVYQVTWNGRDGSGVEVSSGVYFYRLEAGAYTATEKMVLMR